MYAPNSLQAWQEEMCLEHLNYIADQLTELVSALMHSSRNLIDKTKDKKRQTCKKQNATGKI